LLIDLGEREIADLRGGLFIRLDPGGGVLAVGEPDPLGFVGPIKDPTQD
jgi:hypothetical protein